MNANNPTRRKADSWSRAKRFLQHTATVLIFGLGLSALSQAAQTGTAQIPAPPQTPRLTLYAEFVQNTRCPVFKPDEKVSLWLKVDGRRVIDEALLWSLLDLRGRCLGKGSFPIPKGTTPWENVMELPATPSGYFEVSLKLEKTGVTIPQMGSRGEGFVAFAVLPRLEALKLEHVDQSRFGGMGTNFIVSGEFMQGDYFDPVYSLVGMKWCYRGRRLAELAPTAATDYKPVLDPGTIKGKLPYEQKAGLCILTDAHSIPAWLTKYPDNLKTPDGVSPTTNGQSYPPNDFEKYGQLIGAVAAEQAVNRKVNFPSQQRNYYFIHWEPDWHWKGSDEDFIKMYETAHKAIHANDPDGLLLGANYGVLAAGNKHLERLFGKGLGQWLDGIITHSYYIPEFQNPERGNLIQDMRALKEMARRHLKPAAPIINSEWGTNYGSYPALKQHSALIGETARFMRGHIISLGEACDTTMFFYTADMDDHGWGLFFNLNAPNPGCGATNVAPKPVMAAAAFATRLLEGSATMGSLEHLGDGVWGYAFDRAGVTVAALWSVDDVDREVSVPVGVPEITFFDSMGNGSSLKCQGGMAKVRIGSIPCYLMGLSKAAIPVATPIAPQLPGSPIEAPPGAKYLLMRGSASYELGDGGTLTIPRAASAGRFLLVAADPKDAHWVSSTLVEVKPTVSLQLSGSTVKVVNLTAQELKGTLSIAKPGAGGAAFTKELLMPAQGGTEVAVDLEKTGLSSASDIDIAMKFTDASGSETSSNCSLRSSYVARKAFRPPSMDGTLSDWQLELFKSVTGPDTVFGGDANLSFRFAIQYDESALYLAFKVRDQNHCQEQSPGDSWKEDSIQIAVGLHPDAANGWRLFHKFCFAKSTTDDAIIAYRHNGTPELPSGKLTGEDATVKVSRLGDETFYTVAVPWRSLEKSLTSFPAERKIGMGVFVNDVDVVNGTKTARKAMEAFGGMGYTVPKDFGTVTLE